MNTEDKIGDWKDKLADLIDLEADGCAKGLCNANHIIEFVEKYGEKVAKATRKEDITALIKEFEELENLGHTKLSLENVRKIIILILTALQKNHEK